MKITQASKNWDIVRWLCRGENLKYFRPDVSNPGFMELFSTYPCDVCGKPTVGANAIFVDCSQAFLESKNLINADGMTFGECVEIDDESNSHCDLCPKIAATV